MPARSPRASQPASLSDRPAGLGRPRAGDRLGGPVHFSLCSIPPPASASPPPPSSEPGRSTSCSSSAPRAPRAAAAAHSHSAGGWATSAPSPGSRRRQRSQASTRICSGGIAIAAAAPSSYSAGTSTELLMATLHHCSNKSAAEHVSAAITHASTTALRDPALASPALSQLTPLPSRHGSVVWSRPGSPRPRCRQERPPTRSHPACPWPLPSTQRTERSASSHTRCA